MYAGPTVINNQVYSNKERRPVPPNPTHSALVWPQSGSYCIFDGGLGHGVLDSCCSSQRVTLLVNWWTDQPQVRLHLGSCHVPACPHVSNPAQDQQLLVPVLLPFCWGSVRTAFQGQKHHTTQLKGYVIVVPGNSGQGSAARDQQHTQLG